MNHVLEYKKQRSNMPIDFHNNKGVAHCFDNDFDTGISEFNKAIEINYNFPLAYFNRSIAYSNLGMTICKMSDRNKWKILTRDFNNYCKSCKGDKKLIQLVENYYGIKRD